MICTVIVGISYLFLIKSIHPLFFDLGPGNSKLSKVAQVGAMPLFQWHIIPKPQ